MTFSAKFHAVLLKYNRDSLLLYNNIPKVLLYREVFLQKNNFKGVFVLVYSF